MRRLGFLIATGALCLAIGGAQAQPTANTAPPAGGGMGPQMMGGYGAGCPGGQGGGHGHMGCGAGGQTRAGPGSTMGWSLMTPQERQQHQAKMMSFTNAKDCRAYVAEHHRLMAERAKQRGMAVPPTPMHDPCAGLTD